MLEILEVSEIVWSFWQNFLEFLKDSPDSLRNLQETYIHRISKNYQESQKNSNYLLCDQTVAAPERREASKVRLQSLQ